MESAMDLQNDAAGAAVDPLPLLYPPALLSLPDLDRPPAVLEMWEVEAVAAALPAKKRRLRETFERLTACSPSPLPFRWEDLDTYISSLQYSVTLRHRHLRELEKPKPAPALAATAAPVDTSSMSLLPAVPVTGGGDDVVGQVRLLEKPRPTAVLAIPARDFDVVHEPRALVKPKPVVQPQPIPAPAAPAAAAVSAPAPTAAAGVHVEEGRKRKAPIQEAEEVHVAKRTMRAQEGEGQQGAMRGSRKKKTPSPSQDSSNGKESMPVRPQGVDDGNGLAAEANARTNTDATVVQVDPVSKVVAVPQPELPAGPAPATNRVRAPGVPNSTGMQRSPPPRPVVVPVYGAAASAAADISGRDPEKSKKRKAPSQEAEAAASQTVQTQLAARDEVERRDDSVVTTNNQCLHAGGEAKVSPPRPGQRSGSGNGLPITAVTATAEVDAADEDPICKAIREAVPPNYEVPDVEMEIVQPEEVPHVLNLKADASMAAKKARQAQVIIKSEEEEEADKVSPPLPLGCSNAQHAQAAGAAAVTVTMPRAPAAAGATVSPTVTRVCPNLVQASAPDYPKSAAAGGVHAATTRDASASHAATRRAPPSAAAGSQQDASDDVRRPVPPRGRNGLAHSSRVSAGSGTQTDSAAGSPATGVAPAPAPARRELSASNNVPASRRERTTPTEASALPNAAAGKHVLQKQHMPRREPISSPKKQQEWSSKNHGARRPSPMGPRPVPEAQDAAAQSQRPWSRPGEGRRGGELAAASGLRGDDDTNRNSKDSFKGTRRHMFCDRCGYKGHLDENCLTGKHRVAIYQKAKQEREKEQEQICYRCGCTGHWSRSCRTAKHLVDLYQKDRAAKRAAGLLQE